MHIGTKVFSNILKVLIICLVLFLGSVFFGNKETTIEVMNKNTKNQEIKSEYLSKNFKKEHFVEKVKKEEFEKIKKQIEIRTKLNKDLYQKSIPKNKFKRFNFKHNQKNNDNVSLDAKIEDTYIPHWVHNHENGIICKSCSRIPLEKNAKTIDNL